MEGDVVIRAEGLGKKYLISHQAQNTAYPTYGSLRDNIAGSFRRWLRKGNEAPGTDAVEEFWALRDVDFEVRRGEVVGIIGRNGAGKSTLLKVLSRITEPSEGRVAIRGRVASLLEVGTGFHPELTGRENIFLNGAILGMSRAEIRRKFDEIVAFAEIERFLDTPVKRYSSGMYVRLAFAVAAHLEPEILVVDEVLAVGDAEFQRRCLGKMGEICGEGRTVLFVSHNLAAIRQLCRTAVWLDKGKRLATGPTDDIVNRYLATGHRNESIGAINDQVAALPPDPAFRLDGIDIRQGGVSTTELLSGMPVEIEVRYEVLQEHSGMHVLFNLCDLDGTLVFDSLSNGDAAEQLPLIPKGRHVSTATIPGDFLSARSYELQVNAAIHGVREFYKAPPSIHLNVHASGVVNRAFTGYQTPGRIAPLIAWDNRRVDH